MFGGVVLGSAVFASAQQTIYNVPTDVLNRGQIYFEMDASFKTRFC